MYNRLRIIIAIPPKGIYTNMLDDFLETIGASYGGFQTSHNNGRCPFYLLEKPSAFELASVLELNDRFPEAKMVFARELPDQHCKEPYTVEDMRAEIAAAS